MPAVNAAVLLLAFPSGQKLELKGDRAWYTDYFFNPSYGQSAYWAKQSDNNIILTGQVFDWALVKEPYPTLTKRKEVIDFAIAVMQQDRKISFTNFDVVIVVVGVPDNVETDGGATTAISGEVFNFRSHNGIVCRVNDRFDFVAHEIGHALGLNHSYGDWTFKAADWSKHGEYGHPHCIMSAMSYGGTEGAFIPVAPRHGRPEYSGLGPSLNAATALARGWLDAYVYTLQGARPTEIVLRSRNWGGKNQNLAPQALDVRAPNGENFVLEYRENSGWDEGHSSMLIVNHGKGSSADLQYPNTNSATFLKRIVLPFRLGSGANLFNGGGFGIEVLERSLAHHTLRFRIVPGGIKLTRFEFTPKVEIIQDTILEIGDTTFRPGEVNCVEGTWRYKKHSRIQVATVEASYALAVPPVESTWTVDGLALVDKPGGRITLQNKAIRIANPKLADTPSKRNVELRYEIVATSTGSLLRLFNRTEDETFSIEVVGTLRTDLGEASASDVVSFAGITYDYGPEFYRKFFACIAQDLKDRNPQYKPLLPPDTWRRVPEERFVEVEQLLNALSHLKSQRSEGEYQQVLTALESITGVARSEVTFVALEESIDLPRQADQPELLRPPS